MHVCLAQTPQPPPLVRKPAVRLRPFFWNKLAWKPNHIWATVPPGVLSEDQLAALEALFPQAAPSPQAKATKAKSVALPTLHVPQQLCWHVIADR